MLAVNEDRDEYFEIKKIIIQVIANIKMKIIFKLKSIPTYVATPLPPLNFNQIGKTCPKKTLKAEIYTKSEIFNFIYNTGNIALKISRNKVE